MDRREITPLSAAIGGRVTGIDLAAGIDGPTRTWIREGLAAHHVLLFPDQELNAPAFHAFARGFGPLQRHVLRKYRHADFPDLSWLTNVAADGSIDEFGVKRATNWHTDGSYTQDPPVLGILHAYEVPTSGGGTIFANMCAAYATLAPEMKTRVAGLTGLHWHGAGPGGGMYDKSLDKDQEETFDDAIHPAVARHPESDRELLFVNETHTRKFKELDRAASVELVETLTAHATQPEFTYHHDWTPGDLLIWDQWSTTHRGAGDYPPADRRIKIRAIVQRFE